jgi:hypothetical protein
MKTNSPSAGTVTVAVAVIGHHTPRQEPVAHAIEIKQRVLHQLGDM